MTGHICESKEGGNWCSTCGLLLPFYKQPGPKVLTDLDVEKIRSEEKARVLKRLRPIVRRLSARDWTGWDEAMAKLRREVGL